MSQPNKIIVGGASYEQMGESAALRDSFPKGSSTRQELNKIVHNNNYPEYGKVGEYSDKAQKVINNAKKG